MIEPGRVHYLISGDLPPETLPVIVLLALVADKRTNPKGARRGQGCVRLSTGLVGQHDQQTTFASFAICAGHEKFNHLRLGILARLSDDGKDAESD